MPVDKREANAEIKRQMGKKWTPKFVLSEKMDEIQDTFFEAGKKTAMVKETGQAVQLKTSFLVDTLALSGHMAKINPNVSEVCSICNVPETVEHYLFDCDAYDILIRHCYVVWQILESLLELVGAVLHLLLSAPSVFHKTKEWCPVC